MNHLISKFAALFVIGVCCFGCRNAQTKDNSFPTPEAKKSNDARQWIPGDYAGIEIGKSTKSDVIKKFGKPVWEGKEALEGETRDVQKALAANSGKRILLEYRNVNQTEGKTSIFVGEADKIVKAVVFYPVTALTRETILSRYGDDYVVLNSDESICSALKAERRKVSTEKSGSPQTLVFPEKGMYAFVNEAGKIDQLGFSLNCQN